MDFVLIVKVIRFIIWVNALNNALLKLFSTVIHAFNALNHKFGTVLIVSTDALLEKSGLMEIVSVQTTTNGMGIIVLLVLEEKFGMLPLVSVAAHQV